MSNTGNYLDIVKADLLHVEHKIEVLKSRLYLDEAGWQKLQRLKTERNKLTIEYWGLLGQSS
jgi:hypothetical protein